MINNHNIKISTDPIILGWITVWVKKKLGKMSAYTRLFCGVNKIYYFVTVHQCFLQMVELMHIQHAFNTTHTPSPNIIAKAEDDA